MQASAEQSQSKDLVESSQLSVQFKPTHLETTILTTLIILSFTFNDLITSALNLFQCIDVGDEHNKELRLISDFSIDCTKIEYKTWKFFGAMPILAIIGFTFPLFILFKLWRVKKSKLLKQRETLFKYGFFYLAYKKKYYFYDSIVFLRKIIILLIAGIFSDEIQNYGEIYPILLMLIILIILAQISVLWKPFKVAHYNKLNYLEAFSLISIWVTFYVIIFCIAYEDIKNLTKNLCLFVILSMNGIFFINLFVMLYKYKIAITLEKVTTFVKSIFKIPTSKSKLNSRRFTRSLQNSSIRPTSSKKKKRKLKSTFFHISSKRTKSKQFRKSSGGEERSLNNQSIFSRLSVQLPNQTEVQTSTNFIINKSNTNLKMLQSGISNNDGNQLIFKRKQRRDITAFTEPLFNNKLNLSLSLIQNDKEEMKLYKTLLNQFLFPEFLSSFQVEDNWLFSTQASTTIKQSKNSSKEKELSLIVKLYFTFNVEAFQDIESYDFLIQKNSTNIEFQSIPTEITKDFDLAFVANSEWGNKTIQIGYTIELPSSSLSDMAGLTSETFQCSLILNQCENKKYEIHFPLVIYSSAFIILKNYVTVDKPSENVKLMKYQSSLIELYQNNTKKKEEEEEIEAKKEKEKSKDDINLNLEDGILYLADKKIKFQINLNNNFITFPKNDKDHVYVDFIQNSFRNYFDQKLNI